MISSGEFSDNDMNVMAFADAIGRPHDIQPGTLIRDFRNPDEMDQLFNIFGQSIRAMVGGVAVGAEEISDFRAMQKVDVRGHNYKRRMYPGWSIHQKRTLPSFVLRPKDFHGQIRNISTVILRNPLHEQGEPSPTAQVILGADLHSTGRGVRARPMKLVTLEVPATTIQAEYHDLSDVDPQQAIDHLRADSADVARHTAAAGLIHAFSGGLPGLGKH